MPSPVGRARSTHPRTRKPLQSSLRSGGGGGIEMKQDEVREGSDAERAGMRVKQGSPNESGWGFGDAGRTEDASNMFTMQKQR